MADKGWMELSGGRAMTREGKSIAIGRRAVLAGGSALGVVAATPALAKAGPGGFSPEGLKSVAETMQGAVDNGDCAGVVTLLYRHGEIAQVNAIGWQDEIRKTPMRRDTIFRIASMTKPIASVATLILMEEGKLTLTDPVEKFLPELANRKLLPDPAAPLDAAQPSPRGITILDLLTHRSGIVTPDTAPGPLVNALKDADAAKAMGPDEWIKRIGALPLAYEPGTRFNYGNSFDVLGVLIARAAGMKLPELLEARIFKPLGMKDTGFWVPADKMTRFATNYAMDPQTKKRVVSDQSGAESRWAKPPAFPAGAGGLVSTADDYLAFTRMLLGKGRAGGTRLLSHEAVALMTANELTPEQRKMPFSGFEFWAGQGFGLGVSVVDEVARQSRSPFGYSSAGSFGWPGAFGTWWQVDPKEDMIQIFMVQMSAADPRSPLRRFKEASYRAIDD
jgi:CubicO group peptidase (beta-lactamase class C family)